MCSGVAASDQLCPAPRASIVLSPGCCELASFVRQHVADIDRGVGDTVVLAGHHDHRCHPSRFGSADRLRSHRTNRGWQVAEDSGNRGNGTLLASLLARLEAEYGDLLAALHYISLAIRNHHDSGNPTNLRTPMATLTTVLDRMGRYDAAATIGGFGFNPFAVASQPELGPSIVHLRDVLGGQTYESLARKGETMSTAEMVTYAYDQIDQVRAELSAVSK